MKQSQANAEINAHTILWLNRKFFRFDVIQRFGTNMEILLFQCRCQLFAFHSKPIQCFGFIVFECLQRFGTFLISDLEWQNSAHNHIMNFKILNRFNFTHQSQLINSQCVGDEIGLWEIIVDDCLVDRLAFVHIMRSNVVQCEKQRIEWCGHVNISVWISIIVGKPWSWLLIETQYLIKLRLLLLRVQILCGLFSAWIPQGNDFNAVGRCID